MISIPSQKPFRGMQINRSHPLAKGLVGCWVFNEQTGDEVFDLSGNGNHGAFGGNIPTWVSDGISFPSTGDWIDIPHQDLTSNWTIVFEAYCNGGVSPNGAMVLGNGADSQNFIYTGNNVRTRFQNTAGLNADWTADTDFYHKWRQCSFVADTTGVELYLEANSQGRQIITPSFKFYQIGTGHTVSNYDYNGTIRYIHLYNRALSPTEIAWLNREPYAMFQREISPGILYYEAAAGVSPTSVFYGPFVGPLGGPL